MEDAKLKSYFNFDASDLQANQNGQFTEKQKARMAKDSKSNGIMDNLGAYIFLFIALIGVFIALATVVAGFASSNWAVSLPIGLSFGCIWPLAWGSFGVRGLLASGSSKHEFKLAKVQGYANIQSRQPSGETNLIYTLNIGNKAFKVDQSISAAITQGSQYIIYYYIRDDLSALLSTKSILSAENI